MINPRGAGQQTTLDLKARGRLKTSTDNSFTYFPTIARGPASQGRIILAYTTLVTSASNYAAAIMPSMSHVSKQAPNMPNLKGTFRQYPLPGSLRPTDRKSRASMTETTNVVLMTSDSVQARKDGHRKNSFDLIHHWQCHSTLVTERQPV